MARDAGEAKKYMDEELKTLTSKYEPVIAKEAYMRVFNPAIFWSQRFYKKNKKGTYVLIPAEDAKILLENTLTPPKDEMEPYVAEQAFIKIYGEPVFKKVFERDPQAKHVSMEPLPIPPGLETEDVPDPIKAVWEDGTADKEPEIESVEESKEEIEISKEELAEILKERAIAKWRKIPCVKEGCKLKADGQGEKPQFCRHHKEE